MASSILSGYTMIHWQPKIDINKYIEINLLDKLDISDTVIVKVGPKIQYKNTM